MKSCSFCQSGTRCCRVAQLWKLSRFKIWTKNRRISLFPLAVLMRELWIHSGMLKFNFRDLTMRLCSRLCAWMRLLINRLSWLGKAAVTNIHASTFKIQAVGLARSAWFLIRDFNSWYLRVRSAGLDLDESAYPSRYGGSAKTLFLAARHIIRTLTR